MGGGGGGGGDNWGRSVAIVTFGLLEFTVGLWPLDDGNETDDDDTGTHDSTRMWRPW